MNSPADTPRSFTGLKDPAADALLAGMLPRLAADIAAFAARGGTGSLLVSACLGGGYARGEGGVRDGRLCNDVDFYAVIDESAAPDDMRALSAELEKIASPYSDAVGAEVEFCFPKKPSRIHHDRRRIMIQELLRAHVMLYGREFSEFAPLFPAADLPPGEAARLLMNRGMGLLFASERLDAEGRARPEDAVFVARNVNKAVLGAHDAELVARGAYDWSILERAKAVGRPDYDAAVREKFAPSGVYPEDFRPSWEAARTAWKAAREELFARHGRELCRRSLWEAARWPKRRGTLGPLATFGMDCTVRVLDRIMRALAQDRPRTYPELVRDWEIFN